MKEAFLGGQEGESIVYKQTKALFPSFICFLLVYQGLITPSKTFTKRCTRQFISLNLHINDLTICNFMQASSRPFNF